MSSWLIYQFLVNFIIVLLIIFICIINKICENNRKKYIISKNTKWCIITLLLTIFVSENWIHSKDQYNVLRSKFAMPYIIASLLPVENNLIVENLKIKLPYGYKTVNENTAVGIISHEKSWDIFNSYLNTDFEYIEQLGSNKIYKIGTNEKYINIITIRRGKVNSIIIKNIIE